MSELNKYLREHGIDNIEDDEEFCEAESEAVFNYCKERNFEISDDDMNTIIGRGLEESFEEWKERRTHQQIKNPKEETRRVEITFEKTVRVSGKFDVTNDQLQSLLIGDNPFERELEAILVNGETEYDYTVFDEESEKTLVDWS